VANAAARAPYSPFDERAHNVLRILRLAPRQHAEDARLHRQIQHGDSRDRQQDARGMFFSGWRNFRA